MVDLGNNALRFGLWDSPVDWYAIFRSPDFYYQNLSNDEDLQRQFRYKMPASLREKFGRSATIDFDINEEYEKVKREGLRPIVTLERSIEQHATICAENSLDFSDASALAKLLEDEIDYRVKKYSYCIAKNTDNYVKYLQEDYKRKLNLLLNKKFIS